MEEATADHDPERGSRAAPDRLRRAYRLGLTQIIACTAGAVVMIGLSALILVYVLR